MTVPSENTPSSLTDASIPSQNGGSNVTTVSTPAFSVNADSVQKARMSAMDQIAGYIFMCNSNTKPDCFIYRVFGLPASRLAVAEKIKPNTKLFLYDFEVKLLYGMYVADSSGKMAIEPYAFGGRFPAQVKFSILRDCLPLPEAAFKEAIRENYSGGSKFNQTLTKEQVNDLVSLFRPINIPVPLGPPPPLHDGVEIRRLNDGGSTFQSTKFTSHGQYSSGYDHTYIQMCPSSSRSQPYYSQHTQVLVPETYHPDHPGLYKQDTRTRYGTAPQITTAPQQARSSMTVAQWVALASEPQTSVGGDASSSTPTIPSSSEHQPPYSYNHHGQTQVPALPQLPPPPGDSAYMYYNSTTTQPPPPAPGDSAYLYNNSTTTQPPPPPPGDSAYMYNNPTTTQPPPPLPGDNAYMYNNSTTTQPPPPPPGDSAYMYYNTTSTQPALPSSEYQYQGYHQASDQMHPVTYVSETYVPYGATTVPPDYVHQMPAAEVSTDPGAGYASTQYVGPNPTY